MPYMNSGSLDLLKRVGTTCLRACGLLICFCSFKIIIHADDFRLVEVNVKNHSTVRLSNLNLQAPPDRLSRFGGSLELAKQEATGFFRVENVNEVWTFVDPEGYIFISMGINSVNEGGKSLRREFNNRFDSVDDWLSLVDNVMRDLRFNTYANWSDYKTLRVHDRPYTARFSFMASYVRQKGGGKMGYGNFNYEKDVIPVFDSEFELYVLGQAKQFASLADDPYLLGVFSDNELPFNKIDGCLQRYLELGVDDEGYQYALAWMKENHLGEEELTHKHDLEFMNVVIDRYYSIIRRAFDAYLPNHLYLGSRIHGNALRNDSLFRISGLYVDVVSVNYYHKWHPEYNRINNWASLANKPILITEWYAKASDSGLNNSKGAGFLVDSQKDRGYFYENFCLGLLRNPSVIGWHWFRFIDDLKTGAESNKGILNRNFEVYQDLAGSMKAINRKAYSLRRYLIAGGGATYFEKLDQENRLFKP